MKISEVINALEAIKVGRGDLEVWYVDGQQEVIFPVETIEVDEAGDGETVVQIS